MEVIKSVLGVVIGALIFVALLAAFVFYLRAGVYGAYLWFGWSGWWVGALGVFLAMFLSNLGFMVILVVGAYGAYYGWDWEWWLVLVVFFPGFALMFVSGIFSMLFALAARFFRSKAA